MNLAWLEEIEVYVDFPVCAGDWCNNIPILLVSDCEQPHWFNVWGSGDVKVDGKFVCLDCCREYHDLVAISQREHELGI